MLDDTRAVLLTRRRCQTSGLLHTDILYSHYKIPMCGRPNALTTTLVRVFLFIVHFHEEILAVKCVEAFWFLMVVWFTLTSSLKVVYRE